MNNCTRREGPSDKWRQLNYLEFGLTPPLSVTNPRNLPPFGQTLSNPLPPCVLTSFVYAPL